MEKLHEEINKEERIKKYISRFLKRGTLNQAVQFFRRATPNQQPHILNSLEVEERKVLENKLYEIDEEVKQEKEKDEEEKNPCTHHGDEVHGELYGVRCSGCEGRRDFLTEIEIPPGEGYCLQEKCLDRHSLIQHLNETEPEPVHPLSPFESRSGYHKRSNKNPFTRLKLTEDNILTQRQDVCAREEEGYNTSERRQYLADQFNRRIQERAREESKWPIIRKFRNLDIREHNEDQKRENDWSGLDVNADSEEVPPVPEDFPYGKQTVEDVRKERLALLQRKTKTEKAFLESKNPNMQADDARVESHWWTKYFPFGVHACTISSAFDKLIAAYGLVLDVEFQESTHAEFAHIMVAILKESVLINVLYHFTKGKVHLLGPEGGYFLYIEQGSPDEDHDDPPPDEPNLFPEAIVSLEGGHTEFVECERGYSHPRHVNVRI